MPLRLDRALLRVSGPDAVSFLDNLLTQDVTRLAEAGVLYSALLSPQGKLIADMFLWADPGGIVLDLDPARREDVERRLTLYKLRAKVTIDDITSQVQALYAPEPFADSAADPRLPALGWRALSARPQSDAAAGDAAYNTLRLALGVPDLARDATPEEAFAGEALLEELNGVDFKKGCFVGQENVSRMKRRATTRKKFCPIAFNGDAIAPGTPITAGATDLGQVRTGTQGRAMALLRLDRALSALEQGQTLIAAGRAVRLDPPAWLILPPREGAATGAPD